MNNKIKYTLGTLLLLSSHQIAMAENMHIYSLSDDMTFDISLSAGSQTMLANETLRQPDTGHTVSKLVWDTKALAMIGISGALHFQEKYTLNLEYWFSANKSNTKLTDYDWLAYGYTGDNWTDRSISKDTDVSNAYSFDINAEFSTFKVSTTTLSTLIGYRQDSATRKAYGGEYIYSDENFRDTAGSFPDGELGISYQQTWKSPYLGFKTDTQITNSFSLNTKIIYSPFSKVKTLDRHYMRNLVGTSTHDKTTMYAANIGLNYKATESLSLGLNYMYQKYKTTTGDLKWNEEGEIEYINDYVSADLKTSLVSISLDYKF